MCGSELVALPESLQKVATGVNQPEAKLAQQNAIILVAARAGLMAATAEIISPCISVCQMNMATALCEGCFRTRDEIAAWGSAGDAAKLATWALIEKRMAALQA